MREAFESSLPAGLLLLLAFVVGYVSGNNDINEKLTEPIPLDTLDVPAAPSYTRMQQSPIAG